MKAAIFHAPHQALTVETLDVDQPGEGEALIRTIASGICHSDLHYIEGETAIHVPAVLGHEGAGIVEAVGPGVSYVRPGDSVIVCISSFCGACTPCLTGHPNLCEQRPRRSDGASPRLTWRGQPVAQMGNLGTYADRMLVHERNLYKVTHRVSLETAVLISCGVMTGVGAVLNTARIEVGSSVAVIGAGGVGLAAVQGARIGGARQIIAVDVHEHKLRQALELGATHAINASERDPLRAVRALTGGGVDYSFEAIGLKATMEQAFNCLRPGGLATIMGVPGPDVKLALEGRYFFGERKIQGCRMGSNRFRVDFATLLDYYEQGLLRLDEMVSRRLPLGEINDGFRAMRAGEVARQVVLYP